MSQRGLSWVCFNYNNIGLDCDPTFKRMVRSLTGDRPGYTVSYIYSAQRNHFIKFYRGLTVFPALPGRKDKVPSRGIVSRSSNTAKPVLLCDRSARLNSSHIYYSTTLMRSHSLLVLRP